MKSLFRLTKSLQVCVGSLFLLVSGLASAVPVVNYTGGVATSISSLDVGGSLYDVNFVFGSYNSVFSANAPTFLGNPAGADAAANAMMSLFNAEATLPRIGNGGSLGVLWTVFNAGANDYLASQVGYQSGNPWQRFGNFFDSRSADQTRFNWAFAVYSPTAVPEPEALLLFSLGLIGLVIARRKVAK